MTHLETWQEIRKATLERWPSSVLANQLAFQEGKMPTATTVQSILSRIVGGCTEYLVPDHPWGEPGTSTPSLNYITLKYLQDVGGANLQWCPSEDYTTANQWNSVAEEIIKALRLLYVRPVGECTGYVSSWSWNSYMPESGVSRDDAVAEFAAKKYSRWNNGFDFSIGATGMGGQHISLHSRKWRHYNMAIISGTDGVVCGVSTRAPQCNCHDFQIIAQYTIDNHTTTTLGFGNGNYTTDTQVGGFPIPAPFEATDGLSDVIRLDELWGFPELPLPAGTPDNVYQCTITNNFEVTIYPAVDVSYSMIMF